MTDISIILINPINPGNIGAIARVMLNFGFFKLYLVDPKADHLCREAMDRASHAKSVLINAKVIRRYDLKKFDYLVATTSKLGSDYNIPRSPLSPEDLADVLKNKKSNVGIVFGPENLGLSNEEIKESDFVVTIPTYKKSSTMNLSHSVAIILYGIFKKTKKHKIGKVKTATKDTKDRLLSLIQAKLDTLEFSTMEKKETQMVIWKRIIGKSFLTQREASALFGFFKKL